MTQQLLTNRYRIIQALSSGGFGETFLVEDTYMPSRRRCVLKRLKPVTHNPAVYRLLQERFQREAAILETLGESSDQIPRLYAYFVEEENFYLIQEWIEGVTLSHKVQIEGALDEGTVREILTGILTALNNYVHARRIIHRDIKPENIILRRADQKPVLIDFGAVKESISVLLDPQELTQSIVIGTPGYMPSEQAAGRPGYSSDLYSLAMTAVYMLTRRTPLSLVDPATGEVDWHPLAPGVSAELAAVLDKAIQFDPRDRFATALEMLQAIQAIPADGVAATLLPLPSGNLTIASAGSHSTVLTSTAASRHNRPTEIDSVPDEIPGWNWGAFLLPGLWCLSNQVWLGLIAWSGLFTAGLGWLAIGILMGAKGNEWAWQGRRWRSVEAFKAHQRIWTVVGLIVGTNALLIGGLVGAVFLIRDVMLQDTPLSPIILPSANVSDTSAQGTASVVRTLQGHRGALNGIAISPDGKTLASGSVDNTIRLWDVATGEERATLTGHRNEIVELAFTQDGKTLVSCSSDDTIRVWNVETREELRTIAAHSRDVHSIQLTADGEIISSGADGMIKVWNLATGEEVRSLNTNSEKLLKIVLLPDQQTLVSADNRGTIAFWNLNTGTEQSRFTAHTGSINTMAVSPDGKILASGGTDGTVKLWNLANGELLHTLTGHTGWIWNIIFSPDGEAVPTELRGALIASSSLDGTVKLWNLDGTLIDTLAGHAGWVMGTAFTPDGKLLATGSADRTIKIWQINQ
jgi:serine/threonine-protein kinase